MLLLLLLLLLWPQIGRNRCSVVNCSLSMAFHSFLLLNFPPSIKETLNHHALKISKLALMHLVGFEVWVILARCICALPSWSKTPSTTARRYRKRFLINLGTSSSPPRRVEGGTTPGSDLQGVSRCLQRGPRGCPTPGGLVCRFLRSQPRLMRAARRRLPAPRC
jgi:hypothetical protein